MEAELKAGSYKKLIREDIAKMETAIKERQARCE